MSCFDINSLGVTCYINIEISQLYQDRLIYIDKLHRDIVHMEGFCSYQESSEEDMEDDDDDDNVYSTEWELAVARKKVPIC